MSEMNLPEYDVPQNSLKDKYIDNYLKVNINPKPLLLCLTRNYNYNVLCYEVIMDENGEIDPDNIVGNYWLEIDPPLIKEKRERGIVTDRTETTLAENLLGIGINATINEETGAIDVTLGSLKNHIFQLVQNDGNYTLQGIYQGKCCELLKAHGDVEYNSIISKVNEVYLWWKPIDSREILVEKLSDSL